MEIPEVVVRRATTEDAWELVRLRGIMLEATDGICDSGACEATRGDRLPETPIEPGPWQETSVKILRRRLSEPEPTLAAFVVDRPGQPGVLAACAVGTIDERMAEILARAKATRGIAARGANASAGSILRASSQRSTSRNVGGGNAGPRRPTGLSGYIFNVCTEEGYRRRGYSRACMQALLIWYRENGVDRVDLRASPDGEPLYSALGFEHTTGMRLKIPLE